ncbi:MAG: 16S rRNA (guanine(966)-N(2))-methyltransferase RsmD [Angelakisella sp.]
MYCVNHRRRTDLRVITGIARGRKLTTLEGIDVRPTTDMVKEAMFSILQFELEGARVVDLFCGSGQLGVEALSRGAAYCTFVDSSRASQEVTRQNLQDTGLHKNSKVAALDAADFLRTTQGCFDIALLDPPYGKGLLNTVLPLLALKMSPAGVILCESALTDDPPETAGEFVLQKSYRYGKIKLSAYRRPVKDEE